MESESLFEAIYALSNHTTEDETNYLEWPLDTATKPPMYLNESKLFEEIYFEYRLKPLFEQVLREANEVQKPESYAVYENSELVSNSEPTTKEKAYSRFKNTPSHGSTETTISTANPNTGKPFYQSDPEQKIKDDQNNLVDSVNKFDNDEMNKAQIRFSQKS